MRRVNPVHYHPLYFLASLGAGGMAVTFFLYFMFLVDHPDSSSSPRASCRYRSCSG